MKLQEVSSVNLAEGFQESPNSFAEESEKQNGQQEVWHEHNKHDTLVKSHGYSVSIFQTIFGHCFTHGTLGR